MYVVRTCSSKFHLRSTESYSVIGHTGRKMEISLLAILGGAIPSLLLPLDDDALQRCVYLSLSLSSRDPPPPPRSPPRPRRGCDHHNARPYDDKRHNNDCNNGDDIRYGFNNPRQCERSSLVVSVIPFQALPLCLANSSSVDDDDGFLTAEEEEVVGQGEKERDRIPLFSLSGCCRFHLSRMLLSDGGDECGQSIIGRKKTKKGRLERNFSLENAAPPQSWTMYTLE